MISGLAHINLTVPRDTLDQATEFYGTTLGLTPRPVPALQRGTLAWFDIGSSSSSSSSPPQQVHIAFGAATDFAAESSRHPCFRLESPEALLALRQRIWDHYVRGGDAAPKAADKPGEEDSGTFSFSFPSPFPFPSRSSFFNGFKRLERRRIPEALLRPRLRRQQTRIQPVTRRPGGWLGKMRGRRRESQSVWFRCVE